MRLIGSLKISFILGGMMVDGDGVIALNYSNPNWCDLHSKICDRNMSFKEIVCVRLMCVCGFLKTGKDDKINVYCIYLWWPTDHFHMRTLTPVIRHWLRNSYLFCITFILHSFVNRLSVNHSYIPFVLRITLIYA